LNPIADALVATHKEFEAAMEQWSRALGIECKWMDAAIHRRSGVARKRLGP